MRPVDPTVLRRLPSLARHLRQLGVLSLLSAVLIVAQAVALSRLLATAVLDGTVSSGWLGWFGAAVAARALLGGVRRAGSARSAADIKNDLRRRLLPAAATGSAGETATLLGRGVDALDPYVTGYLPQLCLAATVPVVVTVVVGVNDPASLVTVLITVPLVPVLGILVGRHTRTRTRRQWEGMSRLGGHFLDALAGLPTLRVFGRAVAHAGLVADMAHRYRRATMATLRTAFLSALVLELVATVSVALIAVPIGLRLMNGEFDLATAFLVLLLAPEIYLPLRAVGSQFHAAQEGLTALRDGLALIDATDTAPGPIRHPTVDRPGPETGERDTSDRPRPPVHGDLRFHAVRVDHPDRAEPALLGLDAVVRPGEIVALTGPSGAGKTTVLNLLLGFAPLTGGRITWGGTDLADLTEEERLRAIAWVPQRPHLFAMSVADNIRLGQPRATAVDIAAAADAAHVTEFAVDLPDGFDTLLGEDGHGLSAGQRRRVALARAFLRLRLLDCPLVLLDEPTAGLDRHSRDRVTAATTALLAGRTALVVAHRETMVAECDRLWRFRAGHVEELSEMDKTLAVEALS